MHHIVCYSGGETSAIVAIEVVRRYGAERVILLNHDINPTKEDADIKRFKREVADFLGLPITYVNMPRWDEKDQFDVCVEARAFKVGNGQPLCTSRIKTEPFHNWLAEHFPVQKAACRTDVTIYYGFEAKETERIERRANHLGNMGYRTDFPLATWSSMLRTTREIGIEPPTTYEVWKHANCVGCLRAGRQHWYVVYCRRPDVFEKAKWAEQQIGYSILRINNVPVFLHELEPTFAEMKSLGIRADEKVNSTRFWVIVKKILAGKIEVSEADWEPPCQLDMLQMIEGHF